MEAFWTIVVFGFVLGIGAVVGLVFFYWFMIAPHTAESRRR